MRPGGGPGGPGGWGPGPGGPPGPPGWGHGFCGLLSSCLYFLCCCFLIQDCCGPLFGGPPGPPGPFR